MDKVEPGIYVHYKSSDKHYEVIGTGLNTETSEKYVAYRPLYVVDINADFWVRPYDMFISTVEVDGRTVQRFTKVEN